MTFIHGLPGWPNFKWRSVDLRILVKNESGGRSTNYRLGEAEGVSTEQ